MSRDDKYLWRTQPDGARQISWRTWVLVWVVPVGFAAAATWFALVTLYQQHTMIVTQGEVVKVYVWDSENPFDEGPKIYSPLWRYTWSDGTETEATAGVSSSLWNFPIGTKRQIRYWPDRKDDVVLVDATEWLLVRVLAVITLVTLTPALIVTLLIRRWQRRVPVT